MKRMYMPIITAALMLCFGTATMAQAACVAEYKAKRNSPFELYYDVAPISGPCTKANARAQLQAQLAQNGLTLLKVLSVRDQ